MSEVRLQVVRASAKQFTLQARNYDQSVPGVFNQGMNIYSKVTRFNDQTAVLATPSTTWFNAAVAQFMIAFQPSDTTGLELGVFKIITYVDLNGQPVAVYDGQLEIFADARAATNPLPDLVTTVEAENLCSNLTDQQYERLPRFITRVSTAVRSYTRQVLTYGLHDEIQSSREGSKLVLRQLPVRQIERIACDPKTVLTVMNTSGTVQRASCWLTSTGDFLNGFVSSGLAFEQISSGVTTTPAPIAWSNAPTLRQVQAAIKALGNGWDASIDEGMGEFPSADLRGQTVSKLSCGRGKGARFVMHARDITDYMLDEPDVGIVELSTPWSDDQPWLWPEMPVEIVDRQLPITVGSYAYRAIYYAGYKTITGGYSVNELPGDLIEAVGQILQANIVRASLNPMYKSRTLADYSYTLGDMDQVYFPPYAQQLLAPYRDASSNLD